MATNENTTDPIVGAPVSVAVELPPLPTVAEGERFGPYRLIRELGAGGMGRVFLAERADGMFEKQVAIKFVRHDVGSDIALERFRAERRMLARLEHPNIAALLDGGVSESGVPYLVMEYVQGRSINRYCDARRSTIRERVKLFLAVCEAVQHAHQQAIIHRDLKPGNILVTDDGDVKLLDFGIAKLMADEGDDPAEPLTRTGFLMVTPEYASPEQIDGSAVTTASDVYALGIVLYELITGQRPFRFGVRSIAEIGRIVREKTPQRPSTALTEVEGGSSTDGVGRLRNTDPHRLWRQIRGDLDTIILKALRKEPSRRYPTVASFQDDLVRFLDGRPVGAKGDSLRYRAGKFMARHRLGVATAAGVIALVASLIGFYTARITDERDRATAEATKSEQVVGFLQGVLGAARPDRDGRAVTVLEVMREASESIGEEFRDQPDVEAAIRSTIGYTYAGLGLFDESQAQLERSLTVLRELPETEPARLAQAIGDVGRLQHSRAIYDSARASYGRAIEMYRTRAPDHWGLEESLNDLAALLTEQGESAEALALYQETLTLHRARYGDDDPEVGQVLTSMASAHLQLGQREIAVDYLAQAAEIFSRHDGSEQPLTYVLNNLGYASFANGDIAAADSAFRRSIVLRREVYGDRHPEVGLGLHALGSQVLFAQGRYAEAETSLLEAIDIFRETYPEGHVYTSVSLTSLGKVRLATDRLAESEASLWQALGIYERLLPPGHGLTAHARVLLGETLRRQGRLSEAEPLLLDGLASLEGAERNDMADQLAEARRSLTLLYEALDRPADADRYR
ncbi:MAG: serine/threonine-protein kinase [Gemmatimonadetes bacterium]|nr:serine/threonine-protein kinase [Gemmatimonadota bacterium]